MGSTRRGLRNADLRLLGLALFLACSQGKVESESPGDSPSAVQLKNVVGDHRFLEPRLSFFPAHEHCFGEGVNSGSYISRCRSPEQPTGEGLEILRSMRHAAERRQTLEGTEKSEALHTLAIWKLLWQSEETDFESPIDLLLAALRSAPNSAEILSDLTAVYLTEAASGGPPSHYLKAVASAWRATRLDPNNEAARFNLALALEKLPRRATV